MHYLYTKHDANCNANPTHKPTLNGNKKKF